MKIGIEATSRLYAKHQNKVVGITFSRPPYINIIKKGTHDPQFIRQPSAQMIDYLCDNADVIAKITLAPEMVDEKYVRQLITAGMLLFLQATQMPPMKKRVKGFRNGISLSTHLYNAMPYISGRGPGLVGAIYDTLLRFTQGSLPMVYMFHGQNIRNSKRLKGEKLVISDRCDSSCGLDPNKNEMDSFVFAGKTIYYRNGLCVDADGTLSGSSLTMIDAIKK